MNLIKEINNSISAMGFITENYNRLPPLLQLKYAEEVLKFGEAIKPIYVTGVVLLGDNKKGDIKDE